jgi:hypothetical protein
MLLLIALLLLQTPAALSGTTHTDSVPSQLAPAIAQALAPGGVKATVGSASLRFWWVKSLPGPSWSDVAEGSLVGAVTIDHDVRDIRGKTIKPGVYTVRYGIQPANGDHLGVSPFRDFLLICPASADTDPAPRGHDGTIDLSKQTIGGSHPAVWSIDPPSASEAPLAVHTTDLGHKALVVQAGALRFGIVLIGRIEA